jgi:RND family efflux transporter MFP subunit
MTDNITRHAEENTIAHTTRNISTEPSHVADDVPQGGMSRRTLLTGGAVFAVLLFLAVAFGIWSREHAESKLKQTTAAAAIPTVRVTHPSIGSVAQEVVLPGNTQAYMDTPIYARTNGYLKRWYVDIGAQVRQGQLLAEIETPELDQQLQQAQAELRSSQANLDLARTTSTRWQALLAKHAVSKQETDQAVSDSLAKEAAVASSEANVRRLQQLQSYERVTAPFDGVITARNTDVGALIDAGSASGPHELFHLAALERLRVFVEVPEVYADSIVDGLRVSITRDSNPGDVIYGNITRNANAIDHTTRTLNVEVDVDNADSKLLPGAYVFVHLKLPAGINTFTIPSNTLLFRAEGLRVGTVHKDRVQLMPITIGHDFGDTVEVNSGLSAGDFVILDPPDSLADGMQVAPELEAAQGSAP